MGRGEGGGSRRLRGILRGEREGGSDWSCVCFMTNEETFARRLGTLQRRIGEQGAETFVKARGADFMHADVSENGEFKDVTHVLIDPSCSGSGLAADSATGSALTSEYDQPSDSSSKLAVVGGGGEIYIERS